MVRKGEEPQKIDGRCIMRKVELSEGDAEIELSGSVRLVRPNL